MLFTDKPVTCPTCGTVFVVTAGAQAFCFSRGFTAELRRCPSCRTTPPLAAPIRVAVPLSKASDHASRSAAQLSLHSSS
jgi:hypothetical protein